MRPLSYEGLYPGSEYSPEDLEFLLAVEAYQKKHSARFLSFVEIFIIVKSLGYVRLDPPQEVLNHEPHVPLIQPPATKMGPPTGHGKRKRTA